MAQVLSSLFSAFVGLAMLAAAVWFIMSLQQKRWNWFANRFGATQLPAERAAKPGAAIVISNVPHREAFATEYTTYLSISLGVHDAGLSIRVRGPNYYRNRPFLLPYDGLTIQPSKWPDLLYQTVAVSHSGLPDAYLIMARDDIEWAIENGARMEIGDAPSSG